MDRLGQVRVRTGLNSFHFVIFGSPHAGDIDDRDPRKFWVGLDPPAYFQAVNIRQSHVQKNEIRALGPGDLKTLLPRGRAYHVIVRRLENVHKGAGDIWVVIND